MTIDVGHGKLLPVRPCGGGCVAVDQLILPLSEIGVLHRLYGWIACARRVRRVSGGGLADEPLERWAVGTECRHADNQSGFSGRQRDQITPRTSGSCWQSLSLQPTAR